MRQTVIVNWGPHSFLGWGVYGLNLGLAWANDPDIELVYGHHALQGSVILEPDRMRSMGPTFDRTNELVATLSANKGATARLDVPVLVALDTDFLPWPSANGGKLLGSPTIGVTFFESAHLKPEAIARAASYPLIITGSHWNERVLRSYGLTNVKTILQGVDALLFHLAPPEARSDGQFRVFSGGKLECRKGQDIALAAFRQFAERHSDAVLVAAWHSPWPVHAKSVDATGLAAPVTFREDGELDARAWAQANGIRPHQFIDAGKVPNVQMPQLLRQVDVALFPNRGEGGTNLVAMEAMACGVPTILSANTGHLDLIEDENCFVLTHQGEVTYEARAASRGDLPGWGESDVSEAVERLEEAYADRAAARRRGERGAATLANLSWAHNAAAMKEAVLSLVWR